MRQQFDDFDPQSSGGSEDVNSDRKTSLLEILAILGLVGGLLGYGVYQDFVEPMMAASAKKASPSPTKLPFADPGAIASSPRAASAPNQPTSDPTANPLTTPLPSLSPSTPEPTAAAEIYQRAPKNGVYYAQNSLMNASRREIISSNGRFCIKLVNGPAESGQQQVVVSSLSFRNDGIYVDATGEKLQFDRTYTELTDAKGSWLLLESKGDRTGTSAECLSTQGNFAREEKGEMIQRK